MYISKKQGVNLHTLKNFVLPSHYTSKKRGRERADFFLGCKKFFCEGIGFGFDFAFLFSKKIRPGTPPGEAENLIGLIFKLDIERNASHTFADGFIYFRSQFRPQFLLDFLLD